MESKIQNLESEFTRVKGLRTFRARVFWSLIPIILLLVILLGVIDFQQQRQLAEEEFTKRGDAMAANLANGSKLAVFTEDGQLLESSMRSVIGDADFAYVMIYGEEWKMLASAERKGTNVKRLVSELSNEQKDQLLRQRQASIKSIKGKMGRYIEFLVPILSKETNTSYSLQIGSIEKGPGDTEQVQ